MGRAPCCDKATVKKGPWSPEEDSKLKDFIHKHGTAGNWISLPHKAGLSRCGKSCRLRWLNYLRPNIKHGEFSDEEDRIIFTFYASIGSRWSVMAAHLPGRTDNDIKNYWNTKLKKKLLAMQHPPPPSPFPQLSSPDLRLLQQTQQQMIISGASSSIHQNPNPNYNPFLGSSYYQTDGGSFQQPMMCNGEEMKQARNVATINSHGSGNIEMGEWFDYEHRRLVECNNGFLGFQEEDGFMGGAGIRYD